MDFNNLFFNFIASVLIVFRRFIFLIFTPYKTMRKISQEKDYLQLFVIGFIVIIYFYLSSFFRKQSAPFSLLFIIFLLSFSFTILFFYFLGFIFKKNISLSSFIFTFSYSLLPTLIWFFTNSFFYVVLPPPRTASILGQSFSLFFITYSLSLLFWKILLVYLALRFSTQQNFYRIIYYLLLYLLFLIPFSSLMYYWRIFRIPFI